MNQPIHIDRVELFALSADVDQGPTSSLGRMGRRNGMLLKILDRDGCYGWGEVWCNFPPRHSTAMLWLFEDVIVPVVFASTFNHWRDMRPRVEADLRRMRIHTGQPGSFSHCMAALDTAFADFAARRQNQSLSAMLREEGEAPTTLPVYASSPSSGDLFKDLDTIVQQGHKTVKLKLGFGRQKDQEIVRDFQSASANKLELCVDANQAWSIQEATRACEWLEEYKPLFVEEPLLADAPRENWIQLTTNTSLQIAAGENILSKNDFENSLEERSLNVLQPDLAKWGGVSGCFDVANAAHGAGAGYAFHYMGTALGLAATLMVCAASPGEGRVEFDANPNPLRTELGDIDLSILEGRINVPVTPGIGFEPDMAQLKRFSHSQSKLLRS